MKKVLDKVSNWSQFCTYFQLQEKFDRQDTLELLFSEPEFEATMSWKRVAWALYHCSEERAIDDITEYMKSPTGEFVGCIAAEFLFITLFFINFRVYIDYK